MSAFKLKMYNLDVSTSTKLDPKTFGSGRVLGVANSQERDKIFILSPPNLKLIDLTNGNVVWQEDLRNMERNLGISQLHIRQIFYIKSTVVAALPDMMVTITGTSPKSYDVYTYGKYFSEVTNPNANSKIVPLSQLAEKVSNSDTAVIVNMDEENRVHVFETFKTIPTGHMEKLVIEDFTPGKKILKETHAAIIDVGKKVNLWLVLRDEEQTRLTKVSDLTQHQVIKGLPGPLNALGTNELTLYGNVTGRQKGLFANFIIRNHNGLYLYECNESLNCHLINYNPMFSTVEGWNDPDLLATMQLEDINNDGIDELLFTGPSGLQVLSYDTQINEWVSVLDTKKLSTSILHSRYRGIALANNGHCFVLQTVANDIETFKIKLKVDKLEIPEQIADKEDFKALKRPAHTTSASELRLGMDPLPPVLVTLKDSIDFGKLFRNSVDLTSGRIIFSIPLMETVSRLFNFMRISYDSGSQDSFAVGFGWSMPEQYIWLDDQESMFAVDHRYYLGTMGTVIQLFEFGVDPQNPDIKLFTFTNPEKKKPSPDEVFVKFNTATNQWSVPRKEIQYVYGSNDAVSYDVVWENWRGRGNASKGQIRVPKLWYLSEIQGPHQIKILQLNYTKIEEVPETFDKNHSNQGTLTLTREIFLESAKDIFGNTLKLNYLDKTPEELKVEKMEKDGYLEKYTTHSKYLDSYKLGGRKYSQSIQFSYEVIGSRRLLRHITQDRNTALEFTYDDQNTLKNISIPNQMRITNEYLEKKEDSDGSAYMLNFECRTFPKLDFEENFTLVSFIKLNGQLHLAMYAPPASHVIDTFDIGFTSLASYEVIISEHIIGVTGTTSTDKTLAFLIKNKDDKWEISPEKYVLPLNTSVKRGHDYFVYYDPTKLHVMLLDYKDYNVRSRQFLIGQETLLATSPNMFVMCASRTICVGRTVTGDWATNKLKLENKSFGNIEKTRLAIDSLKDLKAERKEKFDTMFKRNAIVLHKNLIMNFQLALDADKVIYMDIQIVVLNSGYGVEKEYHLTVPLQTKSLTKMQEPFEGVTLSYTEDPVTRKLSLKVEPASEKARIQNIIDSLFIFEKYQLTVEGNKFFIGGQEFTWNGDEIQLKKPKVEGDKKEIQFTEALTLENRQNNAKALFVYNNGKLIKFNIDDKRLLKTQWPSYLAYSERDYLHVLRLDQKGEVHEEPRRFYNKYYSNLSTPKLLVTSSLLSEKSNTTVIEIRKYHPLVNTRVVGLQELQLNHESFNRKTRYDYKSGTPTGRTALFEEVTTYEGNNPEHHGYTVYHNSIGGQGTSSVTIYNSKSEYVHYQNLTDTMDQQQSLAEINAAKNLKHSLISDLGGEVEILQPFPYGPDKEEVDYFGFEVYEVDSVNRVYDRNMVTECKFSKTGERCLRINSNQSFTVQYEPENQNVPYKGLAWVRSDFELALESVTYMMKAFIYNGSTHLCSIVSTVKIVNKFDGWNLLEVKVDLSKIKALSLTKTSDPTIIIHDSSGLSNINNESNLSIILQVSPTDSNPIDMDHILFVPTTLQAKVNVYDSSLWKLTAEISTTGLIKKRIFDAYNNELCVINEYNQVEAFSSYTSIGKNIDFAKYGKVPAAITTITGSYGYYEYFSVQSFSKLWSPDLKGVPFKLYPGTIYHEPSKEYHSFAMFANTESIAVRFQYKIPKNSNIMINVNIQINSQGVSYNNETIWNLDDTNEIIIISQGGRLFIIVGGVVVIDNADNQSFVKSNLLFTLVGECYISDLIIMENPKVSINYVNSLGEEIQKIKLSENNTAVIRAFEMDQLGRKVRETFPEKIESKIGEMLLGYNINKLPKEMEKYRKVVYHDDPTSEVRHVTVSNRNSGENAGVIKKYIRLKEADTPEFLLEMYKKNRGYLYQVEQKAGDIREITIYDILRLKVAKYIYSQNFKHKGVFSTYEYTKTGQQKLILPPEAYPHQKYFTTKTPDQVRKAITFTYDSNDRKKSIKSCDAGLRENFYNSKGQLKFLVAYELDDKTPASIIYYNYDRFNRLESTGYTENSANKTKEFFNAYLDSNIIPDGIEYQKFEYSDEVSSPFLATNVLRVITSKSTEEDYPHVEEIVKNVHQNVITNRVYLPKDGLFIRTLGIIKRYSTDKIASIEYPYEHQNNPLRLNYIYDMLDRVTQIEANNQPIVKYEYDAEGLVVKQTFGPNSKGEYAREYEYNEFGHYKKISDKYLRESISYQETKVGNHTYIDGHISEIKFEADWQKSADVLSLLLTEPAFKKKSKIPTEIISLCYKALKEGGFINEENYQGKLFTSWYNGHIPFICAAYVTKINRNIGENHFPQQYGHMYTFNYNNELQKAQYIVGPFPKQTQSLVLTPDHIKKYYPKNYEKIWHQLVEKKFISEYLNPLESSKPFAAAGTNSIIAPKLRAGLLKAKQFVQYPLSDDGFLRPIENMIIAHFIWEGDQGTVLEVYENFFKNEKLLKAVLEVLKTQDLINPELRDIFQTDLQKGVEVLFNHGSVFVESLYDVEALATTLNGNHKSFRIGKKVYTLDYENGTNRLEAVNEISNKESKRFAIKHDSQGNIIRAEHKGIEHIKYHPVMNKPSEILMSDGRVIKYSYNVRGGRISKRVYGKDQELLIEVSYLRDDTGKSLVEREILYLDKKQEPLVTVTAYVYDGKGLIGFFRNNNYYNVWKDHEGSIRLVERAGEIVGAYDYYPYGDLMRSFENNAEAKLNYRYTGHEYDPETDLYFYVARLYDPSIGRFYAMDPKAQYFSPYKYSGNSPVSMVDPDGEFAMFIASIVTGAIGAYLGGAAANGSWLPWQWDFSNKNTWIGMGEGALWGALIPVGFSGSVASLTALHVSRAAAIKIVTGVGLTAATWDAARTQGINPLNWNYADPNLYYNMYTGFADVGMVGDVTALRKVWKLAQFFKSLSTIKRVGYAAASTSMLGLEVYIASANHDFNLMDPDTIKDIIGGLITAPFDTRSIFRNVRSVVKPFKSPKTIIKEATSFKQIAQEFGEIFVKGQKNAIKGSSFTVAFSKDKNTANWNFAGSKAYITQVDNMVEEAFLLERRLDTAKFIKPNDPKLEEVRKQNSSSKKLTHQPDAIKVNREIQNKFNSRQKEAQKLFLNIKSPLAKALKDKHNILSEEKIQKMIKIAEDHIGKSQPFMHDWGVEVKSAALLFIDDLNQKLIKLKFKAGNDPQKEAELQDLVRQLKEIGNVDDFEKDYWEKNPLIGTVLDINALVAPLSNVVEYSTKVIAKCQTTYLPTYYKPSDFVYTESYNFVFSKPFSGCFFCPITSSRLSTSSLTNYLTPVNSSSLFYESPACKSKPTQRKRRAADFYQTVNNTLNYCFQFLNTSMTDLISTHKEGTFNTTETFKPDYSMANVSSTLLLVDMCVRKITGQRFTGFGREITLSEAQAMAINIVEDIETVLNNSLDRHHGMIEEINFVELQCEVFEAIVKDNKSRIRNIAWTYLGSIMEKLTPSEKENINQYFNEHATKPF